MRHLQAIDIGTNSVRSIIVEVPVGGAYRIVDDERDMTRLGQGLDATGMLDPEAMERTVSALRAMMDIGRRMEVDDVRAIATEAVRRASNGDEFVSRLASEAGLEIEVISAEEEGRLVWLSAAAQAKDAPFSAVVDIGGGSVEIVQAVDGEPAAIVSMRLGARVLSERFVDDDPISDAAFKKLKRHIKRALRDEVRPVAAGISLLIGSGGTVTSIASVVAGMRGKRYDSLHGLEIERAEVMRLLGGLSHTTASDRIDMPGMPAERADIILAGVLVLAEVMKLFGASSVLVNARGIREGIVIDTLASDGAINPTPDFSQAVRDLGQRYRADRVHAEHVTSLALSLFDQLAGALHLDPATRPLLESAAMLHDIGYFIAYDRHHEHSYHLIKHSMLPGLTQRELNMVASIARYHTKALPKRSHASWSSVDPSDRATVRSLAAILRVADGLDRGRSARVESVRAEDDGTTTTIHIEGGPDLHAELYGVDKKKNLYEESFGRVLVVDVSDRGNTR